MPLRILVYSFVFTEEVNLVDAHFLGITDNLLNEHPDGLGNFQFRRFGTDGKGLQHEYRLDGHEQKRRPVVRTSKSDIALIKQNAGIEQILRRFLQPFVDQWNVTFPRWARINIFQEGAALPTAPGFPALRIGLPYPCPLFADVPLP